MGFIRKTTQWPYSQGSNSDCSIRRPARKPLGATPPKILWHRSGLNIQSSAYVTNLWCLWDSQLGIVSVRKAWRLNQQFPSLWWKSHYAKPVLAHSYCQCNCGKVPQTKNVLVCVGWYWPCIFCRTVFSRQLAFVLVSQFFAAALCWRDPARSKQLSTIASWLSVWTLSCRCRVKFSTWYHSCFIVVLSLCKNYLYLWVLLPFFYQVFCQSGAAVSVSQGGL